MATAKKKTKPKPASTGSHPFAHSYKLWLQHLEDRIAALEKKAKG